MGILCDVDDEYDHQEVEYVEEHHEPIEEVHGRNTPTHHVSYVPKPYVPLHHSYVPPLTGHHLRRSYGHLPYVGPTHLSHAYVPPVPLHRNALVENAILRNSLRRSGHLVV